MDEKQWETAGQQGMARYVLVHGVLAWGLPLAVGFYLILEFWNIGLPFRAPLPVALMLLVAGGARGLTEWFLAKRKFGPSKQPN